MLAAMTTTLAMPAALAAPAAAPTAAHTPSASGVLLQVVSMTPSSPLISSTPKPLTVELQITNTSATAIGAVKITGLRGDPMATGEELTTAFSRPPTSPSGREIRTKQPVTVNLDASATPRTVTFVTSTETTDETTDGPSSICLCADGVYPLYFQAQRSTTSNSASSTPLATAVTYLPSRATKPQQPVDVSWVWPLVDRPHRLLDDGKDSTADNVFTDDDLATTVGTDGRLTRALATITQLEGAGEVPVTLMIDPELLDELDVMSTGYFVRNGNSSTRGTGGPAAREWLDQLATILASYPKSVAVQLTPYADPDVQSLHSHDLGWSASMPAQMRQHVAALLPGQPITSTVSWPSANAVSSGTLGVLVDKGTRTIVVSASSVTPRDGGTNGSPTGIARLSRHSHTVAAAVTDNTVQRYTSTVVADRPSAATLPGTAQLPQLVSLIAIRAAQAPNSPHSVVITPPRYVDPNPAVAAQAIRDTSVTPYAKAVALATVTKSSKLPRKLSRVRTTVRAAGLPSQIITGATDVRALLPKIDSLLAAGGQRAAQVLAGLPVALQRSTSAAWVRSRSIGIDYANSLDKSARTLTDGVRIVPPNNGGSYTLASSNSPLPVAVHNNLPYSVQIKIVVSTANRAPGFTVKQLGTQTIAADDQRTIRLPARIDRSGQIRLLIQLTTSKGQNLGEAVRLSVHSTALGVVGVIITIVAGAVLLLALLLRLFRRLRARRHKHLAGNAPTGSGRPTQPVGARSAGRE